MSRREPTPEEQELWQLEQIKQGHSRLFARPIGSVVRKLMNQQGYAAVESTHELSEAWGRIVGPKLAVVSRVGKISKGVLLVEVNSSLAMQEAHFQKSNILRELKSQLPAQKISDLRFRVVQF